MWLIYCNHRRKNCRREAGARGSNRLTPTIYFFSIQRPLALVPDCLPQETRLDILMTQLGSENDYDYRPQRYKDAYALYVFKGRGSG